MCLGDVPGGCVPQTPYLVQAISLLNPYLVWAISLLNPYLAQAMCPINPLSLLGDVSHKPPIFTWAIRPFYTLSLLGDVSPKPPIFTFFFPFTPFLFWGMCPPNPLPVNTRYVVIRI